MICELHWRLIVSANNRAQAEEAFRRFEQAIGRKVQLTVCEPYDKVPGTYELTGFHQIENVTRREIYSHALDLAHAIGSNWLITGYETEDNIPPSIEGILDTNQWGKARLDGLVWALFELMLAQ